MGCKVTGLRIKRAENGGLPYPPYQGYHNYPQEQAFAYPFYRAQQNYPPVIYPECLACAEALKPVSAEGREGR